tara:strand:+ start:263 stop:1024 length:762 start_codon:yes stop_codon:yes gene_type:complete
MNYKKKYLKYKLKYLQAKKNILKGGDISDVPGFGNMTTSSFSSESPCSKRNKIVKNREETNCFARACKWIDSGVSAAASCPLTQCAVTAYDLVSDVVGSWDDQNKIEEINLEKESALFDIQQIFNKILKPSDKKVKSKVLQEALKALKKKIEANNKDLNKKTNPQFLHNYAELHKHYEMYLNISKKIDEDNDLTHFAEDIKKAAIDKASALAQDCAIGSLVGDNKNPLVQTIEEVGVGLGVEAVVDKIKDKLW